MNRSAGPLIGATVAAALALGYRLAKPPQQPAPKAPQTAISPTATPSPVVFTSPAVRNAAGDALWRQSLQATGPKGVPIKAHVTILRSAGATSERTEFDLTDGGGRYRLAYTAPQNARGRIVVYDGKTLWQYEPVRQTVLRRSLSQNAIASPFNEASLPSGVIAEIEETATVDGRSAQILTFRDPKGTLLSRRWLDTATKRSLRSETYEPRTGKRLVQVELTRLELLPHPDLALFQPDFPGNPRVLNANAPRSADISKAARRAGLPTTAGNYQLRSAIRSHAAPTILAAEGSDSTSTTDHLIYSNGIDTVSVFAPIKTTEPTTLRPGRNWQEVPLTPDATAFVQTDHQGRTAIAWIQNGKRLVAVSRLPQSELLSLVRNIIVSR
jgi:outer membrane lipoprotein-sorting protein